MSTGLKRSRLEEPGRNPEHPQPQPHHVQVFIPPPRLLAFPEIVMKRSLVFAQIVSPHGKTSPGWFTLAFIALLLTVRRSEPPLQLDVAARLLQ